MARSALVAAALALAWAPACGTAETDVAASGEAAPQLPQPVGFGGQVDGDENAPGYSGSPAEKDDGAGTGGGSASPTGTATTGSGAGPAELTCATETIGLSADDSNSIGSPVYARGLLDAGLAPASASILPHEFLNYYHVPVDRSGAQAGDIAVRAALVKRLDVAAPGQPPRFDLFIGLSAPPVARRPTSLTLAVDVSGSMIGEPLGRARAVARELAGNLGPNDSFALVVWGSEAATLIEPVSGDQAAQRVDEALGADVFADGQSNIAGALTQAYDLARTHLREVNRVVVVTDGGSRLDAQDTLAVQVAAAESAKDGDGGREIQLAGVGVGSVVGYDASVLTALTERGRGAYAFVGRAEEASEILGQRYDEFVHLAARDVSVDVKLPVYLKPTRFYGEEAAVGAKVTPQSLASGDVMSFHLELQEDPAAGCVFDLNGAVTVELNWTAEPGVGSAPQPVPFRFDQVAYAEDAAGLAAPPEAIGDASPAAYRSYAKSRAIIEVASALRSGDAESLAAAHAEVKGLASAARGEFAIPADDAEVSELLGLLTRHPNYEEPQL